MDNKEYSPHDTLNYFMESEIDYYIKHEEQNLLVNINIGTKGTLDQEVNKEWLNTITPVFLDPDYRKVFYYFDSEYQNVSFKNNHIDILMDKMKEYIKLDNKYHVEFDFTRPFRNIETCINKKYNIYIHKVGYNLYSSYEAHVLHKKILKEKKLFDVCFDSVPKYCFWKSFYLLLTLFNESMFQSNICINNYACTNSRFYINEHTENPICVNAYVGSYFEYISELGYILKSISNSYLSPNTKFLIRITDYDKDTISLIEFNKLKYTERSLTKEWNVSL